MGAKFDFSGWATKNDLRCSDGRTIRKDAFKNNDGELCGYDIDLAKNIAEYLLNNREAAEFIPVTPENRLLKLSTGEVDIIIAAMTITPQREKLINFSIPYDNAGQALLVKSSSTVNSMSDLVGQNVGVIWGTTAEKNMQSLAPMANVIGFKSYQDAYIEKVNNYFIGIIFA